MKAHTGQDRVDELTTAVRAAVGAAVESCGPGTIALSGGLDSSIIAALRAGSESTRTMSVIAGDFESPDGAYGQAMARRAGLEHEVVNASTSEALDAVEEATRVLGTYSPMEIRSAAVICIALRAARRSGAGLVITGDGADELFAGYSFLARAPRAQLRERLKRLQRIMHFPSMRMAEAMGIKMASPYLDRAVVEVSRTVPEEMLVHGEGDARVGKWILRKAFERDVPHEIAWRQKVPMSRGAGLDGLGGFLDRAMSDGTFAERARRILEDDGVRIRDKESLHYYEVRRRFHDAPARAPDGAPECPDCHSDVSANDARFCRMCGRFPL